MKNALEDGGIEPPTSRMQSERSTAELIPLTVSSFEEGDYNICSFFDVWNLHHVFSENNWNQRLRVHLVLNWNQRLRVSLAFTVKFTKNLLNL